MITGLLQKPLTMPIEGSAEQEPQTMEEVLKKKREKLAADKLHIGPELDSSV